MAMTYAQITTRVLQILQDTGIAIYDSDETNVLIEEGLKEFSTYIPHIVGVVFQIESRTGTDVTGTDDKLTDAVKDQFLATDDENEKVIHNTTDNTWAVVTGEDEPDVLTLSDDIMDANENYRIYHRRCRNAKQIYLGSYGDYKWNPADYLWVDSVEYPIGTKRNWKVYGDVLEIDVDSVADSNLNVTTLPNIDVLVRFAKPHRLLQLTAKTGLVEVMGAVYHASGAGNSYLAGGVAMPVNGFTDGQICEVGDEFYIANHRNLYTCTQQITWASQAGAGSVLHYYPPLEADAPHGDYITFVKSTLQPQHEKMLIELIVAKALISKGIDSIGEVNVGGMNTWRNFQDAGERRLGIVLSELRRMTPPKTKHTYPKD